MRSFVGLPVPEPLLPALLAAQAQVPQGREVPEDNLHLTLAFLGDVDPASLEELDLALEGRRLPVAEVALAGLATFGDPRPKVLAAEVVLSPSLKALRRLIAAAVRAAGLAMPAERFRPHITLRRFGRGLDLRAQTGLHAALGQTVLRASAPCLAAELVLYRSDLGPGGARYTDLARYALQP